MQTNQNDGAKAERKILATKSGWLIGVDILRETPKAVIVKAWDEKKERRLSKDSANEKLFDCADAAQAWIKS